MSRLSAFGLAELTDGIARGCLTLAEVAGIRAQELTAILALAVSFLEAGRHQDAQILASGLIALFPYDGRCWRVLGTSRQLSGDLGGARAAYDTALLLAPTYTETLRRRAELPLSEALIKPAAPPPPTVAQPAVSTTSTFVLSDLRPLPLDESPFAATITRTLTCAPDVNPGRGVMWDAEEPTATVILPRRGQNAAPLIDDAHETTAIVRRRRRLPLTEETES